MTFHGRSSRWAAALAFGLAGLIGMGAATVLAAPSARTAASAFELTVDAKLTPPFFLSSEGGTFRSRAPFCASGTFVDGDHWFRFTCDDGTGSLTLALRQDATWRIADGSGSYAGLLGRGSLRGEVLCGETCDLGRPIPWRGTLLGVADWDAVAPSIDISKATATKLRRHAGAYSIRLAVALRDDVADNPVSYTLRVSAESCARAIKRCGGRLELARRFGIATMEAAVPMTLRIVPRAGVQTVLLQLTADDPVGNHRTASRSLSLPR